MTRANRTDVARLAGVSTTVVSYVINDGPRPVAPDTRARVLAAMDQLKYRPNASARALKLARTNVLGLLMTDITNPYFSEFARYFQDYAFAQGRGLMIANTGQDGVKELPELHNMLAREVDGIAIYGVVRPETMETIVSAGIKVVSMDWHLEQPDVPSVGIDDYGATRQAVEHLLWHGHDEVALIAGAGDLTLRPKAWADVMAPRVSDARLAELKAVAEFTREGGYGAALELMALPDPPRAIFASSDVQAFGALRAIQRSGRRVPEDVAVISLDGTNASAYTLPSLTAIQVPLELIAQYCIEKLTGNDLQATHITVPHTLAIRESCGCPPGS
ncbi:LacI family DNA-binding transcriptional regulator [Microbacterium maritypicum]